MAAQLQPHPSAWDASIRSPAQRYLSVEGSRVRYVGPGSDDRDAAAVRANHPVPSDCPIFYFEVEITSRGRDGFIGEQHQRHQDVLRVLDVLVRHVLDEQRARRVDDGRRHHLHRR